MNNWLLIFFAAYIMGSLSPSYIMGKLFLDKDLSQEGSGNLGARNSFKVGGLLFGGSVFLLDILKGAATLLWIGSIGSEPVLLYLGALGVVLGHNYSLYLNFRGGKGLAAMVGILAVLDYRVLLAMAGIAIFFLLISKSSSIAAMMMALLYSFVYWAFSGDWRSFPFMILLSLLVLAKHRPEEHVALKRFLWNRKK